MYENISTKDFNAWQIGNHFNSISFLFSITLPCCDSQKEIFISISDIEMSRNEFFKIATFWHPSNINFKHFYTKLLFPLRYCFDYLKMWLLNKRFFFPIFQDVGMCLSGLVSSSLHFAQSLAVGWKVNLWRAHYAGHLKIFTFLKASTDFFTSDFHSSWKSIIVA